MTTTPVTLDHPLVRAYLDTLRQESAVLSALRREELLADLGEHITASLARTASDADVRRVLDELGDPRTIVTAALAEEPPAPARPVPTRHTKGLLCLLSLTGALVALSPQVGTLALLVGLVLLWRAPEWENRAKGIGTAGVLATPLLLLGFGLLAAGRIGPVEILLSLIVWLTIPTLTSVYLWRQAGARAG
ncbi:HAAS signaling domain-containing protein [Streptomyces sp. LE64]|uniref:HAAS signaling domain-containing protein n=1 Tax=unclassified Streptomyces TaxID=2593676 RepID=UPI00331B09BE